MARKDLSKMTDVEYKALSPQDLMLYNKSLPETDYENPYLHQAFPCWMYRKNGGVLDTALVKDEKELIALGKGWEKSPQAFGVQTAPAAPKIPVVAYTIPIIASNSEATEDAPARP